MNIYENQSEIRCFGRVSIPCSSCGTRHDVPYVVSRNETYRCFKIFVTHSFLYISFNQSSTI